MLTTIERLKFALLAEGMRITRAARTHLAGSNGTRPLSLADYATTSGIPLRLPGDIWVNVPVSEYNPNFVQNPRHVLDWSPEGFAICADGGVVPADPIPVPEYSQRSNLAGEPHAWYGVTHTDRVRISPIGGCANSCSFCDSPRTANYRRKRIDLLLQCVRDALGDPVLPARHVLISGGTPRPSDYGYLAEVYAQVLAAFPATPVDIMMMPLPRLLDAADLHRMGVNELSINLELFNERARGRLIPQKTAIPMSEWLAFIASAVQTVGLKVRSLLIVGLEPVKDTLRGVEALVARGCQPVLSPFRPAPQSLLAHVAPPTADLLANVFEQARDVAECLGGKLGPRCLPCQHNVLALPDTSGYYHS